MASGSTTVVTVTIRGTVTAGFAFASIPTVLAGSVFLGAITAVAINAATRGGAGLFGAEARFKVLCRTAAGGLLEIRHNGILG
jgi:hypothetical protein